ncbi:MAG: fibrobacter succinogenes major paralogous domain-containing protein [Fibrobacter sp.]|uniref:fibrobacter succinogenes major paralogous domain-containing protein n=1 Tax=Fibrobacter sp. TaxID=35828 RepID=UPI0025B94853|nr:fibrobacter succinogenes major paralogous domain-containing protein [Fibrobacter sp.]MBS7272185.1 fibrobacter succinogenes major paralogous domain-containing protein [Fibrobacter sp.]
MTANKRNNTRIVSGLQKVYFAAAFSLLLAACGGDSGSGAKGSEPAEGADDGREVATLVDMGRCTSEREGDTVYVAEKLTDYLCKNNSWVDLSEVSSDMSSGITDSDTKSSSSKGTGSTDETDPSSSDSDTDTPEGFVQENISVTGVAQKGPFKFGSPLNLYELKKNLTPSGTVYKDEISSNKGDFVIPKVSLAYPYAKLEVRGLYRNEVTGEWSTDSMTLRVLTDFSEERTDVNINLLTHLEYDRALYLVQEKGYSVYAAKKQAAQEIMTAFEFATAVTYSEDFAIFQNEGVSATTSAGNATLLAISALVMGNRSDAEIQNTIDKFIADIKTDGEWNDLQTKASMADWAYDFNYSTIKASVKNWNILDIPAYETYLDIYWNNVYGLGGCSVNRKDVVAPNSNKLSKNYNKYFICNGSQWDPATTFQKDTYEWATGKTGEFKKGNVTDSIYVYNGNKWEVSERETAIGLCQNSNAGVVSEFDDVYYICKNNAWGTATVLEYDTYGLTGVEGDVKAGVVNKDKYYVYENGAWRVAANDQEIALGVCTTAREGVVAENGGTYYICKSKTWATATELEYDTYGWNAGEEGEMRAGNVNMNTYYVYRNGEWISSHGSLRDSRDGKTYKTVIIGTQTWMAENLNYVSAQSFCYNGIADNCTKYGRLYSWSAAMDSSVTGCRSLDVCSPTYPVRGICPKGWHLPDSTEWEVLFSAVGGKSIASKVLRSTSGWKCYYDDQCWNGIDAFGFSALSAGYWYGYGGASSYFEGEFTNALFWSSTQARSPNTSLYAYCRIFYSSKDDVDSRDQCRKVHRLSIRCLQDSN